MKPWWQSKTIWFNGAAIGATWLVNHLGVLQAAGISPEVQTLLIAGINLVLRFQTTQAVR